MYYHNFVNKPNLLLIVVDSLRSDQVSKSNIYPNLKSLLTNSTHFETCISSAASTILGMGTMLTGQFPFKIGLGDKNFRRLNPEIPTFTHFLKQLGYDLHATVPKIANEFGLTCNFSDDKKDYENYYSLFAGLGDEIIKKLEIQDNKKPWFFYMHIFDLHSPVIVPPQFNDLKFGISQYERMVYAIDDWLGKIIKKINFDDTLLILTSDHGEYIPISNTKNGIINLEPSFTEKTLWRFGNKIPDDLKPLKLKLGSTFRKTRNKIKSMKMDNEFLTTYQKRILLNSRMEEGHRMFDDLLKTPLIICGKGIPKNKKISNIIRQVDIFPTIFDLIGFQYDNKKIDGKSLKFLFSENIETNIDCYIESPPSRQIDSKKFIGIRNNEYKLIESLDRDISHRELYDLKNDPFEENNISENNLELVNSLEKKLEKIRGNFSNNDEENTDFSEKEKINEILKKLGYQ